MAKIKPADLVPGDIVLFEWNNHTWHTGIYVGDTGSMKAGLAHCEGATKGTAIDPLAENHKVAVNVYAFRAPATHTDALRDVLALARTWAPVVANKASSTSDYGLTRGSAVLKEYDRTVPGKTPAFEYDAMYRVFKWLDGRQRFSENQGTTCCAFAVACLQAGMMRHFLEQNELLGMLSNIQGKLDDNRQKKNKPSQQKAEEILKGELQAKAKKGTVVQVKPADAKKVMARKQYANPGTTNAGFTDIDALWETIKKDVCFLWENGTTLKDVLTEPLLCDAKFTYSHVLYERLRAANGWMSLPTI